MKKLVLSVAMLALGTTAMAQNGYVAFNVGYGLGFPSEQLGTTTVFDANGDYTESNNYGTLGQGINLNLTPGYMVTSNFGLEIGLGYFMGSEVVTSETNTPTSTSSFTSQSSQVRITPALVISSDNDAGINLYGKAGLVLPVGGSTETIYDRAGDGSVTNPDINNVYESKGAFSLGFSGTFGASYAVSDKLSVFGELNGVFLQIKGESQTQTAGTYNGQSSIDGADKSSLETVFVDELNASSNNSGTNPGGYDVNQADEQLASKTNFNGTFINIGVAFSF